MRFLLLLTLIIATPLHAICKEATIGTIDNSEKINRYLRNINNIPQDRFKKQATIQILDKTTAKSLNKELTMKESFSYGNIQIIPHKCWQSPPSQKPDSKILLEVNEVNPKDNTDIKNIFLGWMISSSPSISGLQHPIYDITALNCQD